MSHGRQAGGQRWVGYSDCDKHICTEGGPCKSCRIETLEAERESYLTTANKLAKRCAKAEIEVDRLRKERDHVNQLLKAYRGFIFHAALQESEKWSELTDRLKHAQQYFLEMARGSQEGEDFVLAEVCYRAEKRIIELETEREMVKALPEKWREDSFPNCLYCVCSKNDCADELDEIMKSNSEVSPQATEGEK